ncbi:hypothetical protein AMAG_20359 [Allomyces macrogynus ATCC 38327]|uniref:Uncharacterized protein n=1 Tax=Allomyces macrogynus (strain ATCC 38327) TaxID=578462 RepID=A0A0L0T9Q6_ALLM3|nr:hypothetical protein AMAG_20359 [Allomyces macrogynus ATCC 38327]|eukprot:KNE71457.1 hypothetical protein AMAG_20359 [Allomyces macrogynus ATCC 38327]
MLSVPTPTPITISDGICDCKCPLHGPGNPLPHAPTTLYPEPTPPRPPIRTISRSTSTVDDFVPDSTITSCCCVRVRLRDATLLVLGIDFVLCTVSLAMDLGVGDLVPFSAQETALMSVQLAIAIWGLAAAFYRHALLFYAFSFTFTLFAIVVELVFDEDGSSSCLRMSMTYLYWTYGAALKSDADAAKRAARWSSVEDGLASPGETQTVAPKTKSA